MLYHYCYIYLGMNGPKDAFSSQKIAILSQIHPLKVHKSIVFHFEYSMHTCAVIAKANNELIQKGRLSIMAKLIIHMHRLLELEIRAC